MTFIKGAPSNLEPKPWPRAKRILSDCRGVAAIEFALVAPFLICLYFMTMEVSQAIDVNRKVSRLSSMVADLVTQQTQITPEQTEAIISIGQQILQPYGRTDPNVTITAIEVAKDGKARIRWSARTDGDQFTMHPFAVNSTTTVPASLNIPETYVIKVNADLNYVPVLLWTAAGKEALGLMSAFDSIQMQETYYLRPRMSPDVKCIGC